MAPEMLKFNQSTNDLQRRKLSRVKGDSCSFAWAIDAWPRRLGAAGVGAATKASEATFSSAKPPDILLGKQNKQKALQLHDLVSLKVSVNVNSIIQDQNWQHKFCWHVVNS